MENDQMNQPVTRVEFQNEIKKLATKEDLKKFATKEDLVKLAENTSKEIKRLDGKIDWVASKVMEIREYVNERFTLVLNKLDGIAGVLDVIRS